METTIDIAIITPSINLVYNQLGKTAKVFRNGKHVPGDMIFFPSDYTVDRFRDYAEQMKLKYN
jgi:hypothetical protein